MENIGHKTRKGSLKEAIIDLYLHVKVRSKDDIANYTKEKYMEEKTRLKEVDSFVILDYIRSSVEMIMNLKLSDPEISSVGVPQSLTMNKSDASSSDPVRVYESMVQKLEAEARNHIRVEQQLKLHIENIQQRMEDADTQNAKLKQETDKLREELRDREKSICDLEKEIVVLNGSITSYTRKLEMQTRKCEVSRAGGHEGIKYLAETNIRRERSLQRIVPQGKIVSKPSLDKKREKEIFQIIRKSIDQMRKPCLVLNTHREEKTKLPNKKERIIERSNSIPGNCRGLTMKNSEDTHAKLFTTTEKFRQLSCMIGKKYTKEDIEKRRGVSTSKSRPQTCIQKSVQTKRHIGK